MENVAAVMTHWAPENWKEAFSVKDYEIVPRFQLDTIGKTCSTMDDCYKECAAHYLRFNDKASWRDFAQRMYLSGAKPASLEALKPYLPPKGMFAAYYTSASCILKGAMYMYV